MKPIILYPSNYFNINEVDDEYKAEQKEAKKHGFLTYNINFDAFKEGKRVKLNASWHMSGTCTAIYRGWMLKAEEYERLYDELKLFHNIVLINNPKEYETMHYFPNAYETIKHLTPKTIWFESEGQVDWDIIRQNFSKFIFKDYVKSVKEWNFPDYLTSEMSDIELHRHLEKFIELRGGLLSGGIVVKEYIDLYKDEHGNTSELRLFFMNNELTNVFSKSSAIGEIHNLVDINDETYKKFRSNFYTVDLALTKDGKLVPIEVGDGQVSGIPSLDRWSVEDVEPFYNELDKRFS